mmetsp:Transcript_46204/g.91577  ORF Transcript_46204/g.91577 Transcript_46204/m.91577 type:complete len:93 (-) Transcript_46204:100-378(-)
MSGTDPAALQRTMAALTDGMMWAVLTDRPPQQRNLWRLSQQQQWQQQQQQRRGQPGSHWPSRLYHSGGLTPLPHQNPCLPTGEPVVLPPPLC